jgi:hypothetical protein
MQIVSTKCVVIWINLHWMWDFLWQTKLIVQDRCDLCALDCLTKFFYSVNSHCKYKILSEWNILKQVSQRFWNFGHYLLNYTAEHPKRLWVFAFLWFKSCFMHTYRRMDSPILDSLQNWSLKKCNTNVGNYLPINSV